MISKSDNIYHILKFGAVRLMTGDFEGASKLYAQVIHLDSAWSAFAHYNRAYCTIQTKGDDYIKSAIHDLRDALRKLEAHKETCLFSEIYSNASLRANLPDKKTCLFYYVDHSDIWIGMDENDKRRSFYTMMECQLFHHINTQIFETIKKLEAIDAKGEIDNCATGYSRFNTGCRFQGQSKCYRDIVSWVYCSLTTSM